MIHWAAEGYEVLGLNHSGSARKLLVNEFSQNEDLGYPPGRERHDDYFLN